jgi:pentose-5-phosphate-3-epimerase/putative flippase GtrA
MKSLFDALPTSLRTNKHERTVRSTAIPGGPLIIPLRIRLLRTARWMIWRYRYLAGFVIFGFLSLVLEVMLIEAVLPQSWSLFTRSLIGFSAGLIFAFYTNARFNFRVPREYFLRTFMLFAGVAGLSFALNLAAATLTPFFESAGYPSSRFLTAGCLFLVAYNLHRRFTFRGVMRNFGLALYLDDPEELSAAFRRVGDQLDHLHIDIVDETFRSDAPPADLTLLRDVRRMWTWQPICLHVMSRQPLRWIEKCWDDFDWLLIHTDIEDDVMDIIARCRERRRKVGVVWHHTVSMADMMPFLPHVDYVMVLGIERPGYSGQSIMPEALEIAQMFSDLSIRYGYEVIFDGGIRPDNVHRVAARYAVSNSSVLKSESPVLSALAIMAGGVNGSR